MKRADVSAEHCEMEGTIADCRFSTEEPEQRRSFNRRRGLKPGGRHSDQKGPDQNLRVRSRQSRTPDRAPTPSLSGGRAGAFVHDLVAIVHCRGRADLFAGESSVRIQGGGSCGGPNVAGLQRFVSSLWWCSWPRSSLVPQRLPSSTNRSMMMVDPGGGADAGAPRFDLADRSVGGGRCCQPERHPRILQIRRGRTGRRDLRPHHDRRRPGGVCRGCHRPFPRRRQLELGRRHPLHRRGRGPSLGAGVLDLGRRHVLVRPARRGSAERQRFSRQRPLERG